MSTEAGRGAIFFQFLFSLDHGFNFRVKLELYLISIPRRNNTILFTFTKDHRSISQEYFCFALM